MQRHRLKALLTLAAATSLAACGGGAGHSNVAVVPGAVSEGFDHLADATFRITIPGATPSTARQHRNYVSQATKSLKFALTSASALSPAQVTAYNAQALGTFNVAAGSATCPPSGANYICTFVLKLPPGTDGLALTTYDALGAAGNILSAQSTTLSIVAGVSNSIAFTLDANPNTFALAAFSGQCTATVNLANGATFTASGTQPFTFTATYADLASKPIVGPGLPKLTVNGFADSAPHTIAGIGGNVTVAIDQAAQTFTLTPSTTATVASINVAAIPPNSAGTNDGLVFNKTIAYTFASGPGEPPNFFAAVEQTGGTAGRIDLFTLALGATDTFTPYTTATLAALGGDVDNPQDLLFDAAGDLLVANGGAGGTDTGNFACVPASALATGANAATVISSHANDPVAIALGTDGSVGVSNFPASSNVHFLDYIQNPGYVEASATREISNVQDPGLGSLGVVALPTTPTNPAGTFAVSLSDGGANSRVTIKHPDGSTTDIIDPTIASPYIAYDPANAQLVIGSTANCAAGSCATAVTAYLDGYTVGAVPSQTKSEVLDNAGGSPPSSNTKVSVIAASPTGFIAVGGITASGLPEVQVYDNVASSRAPVGGPIPYDATTTSNGATYVYGGAGAVVVVNSLRFLTGNKLLVGLRSDNPAKQGFYIYDIAQLVSPCTCFDNNGLQFANSPKQTGFQQTLSSPLAAAFKP